MRSIHWLMMCVVVASGALVLAQAPASGVPVEVGGRTIFVLRAGVGSFTPAERAAAVSGRLAEVAARRRSPSRVGVQMSDVGRLLQIDGTPIVSVTDADALAAGVSLPALAGQWSAAIDDGLTLTRARDATQTFARRLIVTVSVIALALAVLWLLPRGRRAAARRVASAGFCSRGLRFRGVALITAAAALRGVDRAIAAAFAALGLVIVSVALILVFGQFPATQGYASTAFQWVWQPLVDIFWGTVGYLPHLVTILVIILVTRTLMRMIGVLFDQADRGTISLEPWVPRDVAHPTSVLVRAAVGLIALLFIAPLIPGTGSTAARGLSVIIGLAVSFGSSSTVGNLIAGIILAYMRPYKLGDRVRVAETTGDIVERSFLHTKVLTIKNEEVVIPSLAVIGSAMTNYSARAAREGLIVHTTVTIGYDAPWRTVHALLIAAAVETPDIVPAPPPFVLQTALDDWFVSYQINAYTREPNRMAVILSDLHERIQDRFNEAGVEIMSPHYLQLRDGNAPAIPAPYAGQGGPSRSFLVETVTKERQRGQPT